MFNSFWFSFKRDGVKWDICRFSICLQLLVVSDCLGILRVIETSCLCVKLRWPHYSISLTERYVGGHISNYAYLILTPSGNHPSAYSSRQCDNMDGSIQQNIRAVVSAAIIQFASSATSTCSVSPFPCPSTHTLHNLQPFYLNLPVKEQTWMNTDYICRLLYDCNRQFFPSRPLSTRFPIFVIHDSPTDY
jgi:hypothetical protein